MKTAYPICSGRSKKGYPCTSVGFYKGGFCLRHADFEDVREHEFAKARKGIAQSKKKLAVFREWVKQ